MSKPVVTPVEERIDHEEARERLTAWLDESKMQARYHRPYANPGELRAEEAITALLPFYRETRREVEGLTRKMSTEDQDEYLTRFRRAEQALAALTPDEGAEG